MDLSDKCFLWIMSILIFVSILPVFAGIDFTDYFCKESPNRTWQGVIIGIHNLNCEENDIDGYNVICKEYNGNNWNEKYKIYFNKWSGLHSELTNAEIGDWIIANYNPISENFKYTFYHTNLLNWGDIKWRRD